MTAHELAKHLLEQPDFPVFMNGWGSDEGITCQVIGTHVLDGTMQTPKGSTIRKEIHLLHEEVKW